MCVLWWMGHVEAGVWGWGNTRDEAWGWGLPVGDVAY